MKINLGRSIKFSLKKPKSCVTKYPEPKQLLAVLRRPQHLSYFLTRVVNHIVHLCKCIYLHKHMHKEVCIVYIPNLSEKKLSTIETIFYCFV